MLVIALEMQGYLGSRIAEIKCLYLNGAFLKRKKFLRPTMTPLFDSVDVAKSYKYRPSRGFGFFLCASVL